MKYYPSKMTILIVLFLVAGFLVDTSQQQANGIEYRVFNFFAGKFPKGLQILDKPERCQVSWSNAKAELRDNARGEHELVVVLQDLGAKMYHTKHASFLKEFNDDCVTGVAESLNKMMVKSDKPNLEAEKAGKAEANNKEAELQVALSEAEVSKLRQQVLGLQYKLDSALVKLKAVVVKLESSKLDEVTPAVDEQAEQIEKEVDPAPKKDPSIDLIWKLEARESEIVKLKARVRELKSHIREREAYNNQTIEFVKSSLASKQAELDQLKYQMSSQRSYYNNQGIVEVVRPRNIAEELENKRNSVPVEITWQHKRYHHC